MTLYAHHHPGQGGPHHARDQHRRHAGPAHRHRDLDRHGLAVPQRLSRRASQAAASEGIAGRRLPLAVGAVV